LENKSNFQLHGAKTADFKFRTWNQFNVHRNIVDVKVSIKVVNHFARMIESLVFHLDKWLITFADIQETAATKVGELFDLKKKTKLKSCCITRN
jgi:hypothetical protein